MLPQVETLRGIAKMISLKPAYMSRYAAIAKLMLKYGHGDVVKDIGLDAIADDPPRSNGAPDGKEPDDKGPEALARDLEQLGPTFVKLGQLLSTRPDFLPPEYLEALERLQDHVEPLDSETIEKIVEEELGFKLKVGFSEFDLNPVASASIGQVHRAKLRDGRRVAVKVQRPDIHTQVHDDLAAMQELGTLIDEHTQVGRRVRFAQIIESLREVMTYELDYRQEAENCRVLKRNLQSFEKFVIPEVVDDYTTQRVITLEYLEGAKITHVSPVVLIELDRKGLAEDLFRIYLHQVLIDGVFHADPHPGNLMLTQDGRIGLMDFGMVARVPPEMQRHMVKLLMALGDGRAEEAAREAILIGRPFKKGHFKEDEFREQVARGVTAQRGKPLSELQAGRVIMQLNSMAGECGLKLPNPVLMLGKTLMNLDKVVSVLDPEFDPNAALRRYTNEIIARHGSERLTKGHLYAALLESAEFAERLPERANKFAELLANNKLKLEVDAIDEQRLMAGLQKIANRITTGLILAAMIIGASLMMRMNVSPSLFGYPLIAMLLFIGAAVASCVLVWRMAFHDESPEA
jgi:predicted unusual protein kinase regulating ubiquinone biosynthesis (AarF/ABC1/UbiB family)